MEHMNEAMIGLHNEPKDDVTDAAIRAFRRYAVAIQDNGCWNYTGPIGPKDYGFVYTRAPNRGKKRMFLAHRVAYFIHYGEIPKGAFICHSCDNPKCCNPRHLFAGTNNDNVQDFNRKNLRRRGSDAHNAVLNEESVKEIKAALRGGATCAALSRRFKCSKGAISNIKRGLNWRHVS